MVDLAFERNGSSYALGCFQLIQYRHPYHPTIDDCPTDSIDRILAHYESQRNSFFVDFLVRLVKQRGRIPTLKSKNLSANVEDPCLKNTQSTAIPTGRGWSRSLLIGSRGVDHQLLGTAVRRDWDDLAAGILFASSAASFLDKPDLFWLLSRISLSGHVLLPCHLVP